MGAPFQSYNILDDTELRQGLKEYSNWPTFPQLYVKGELVGGCDIIREMYESGELGDFLKEKGIAAVAPAAAHETADSPGAGLPCPPAGR